MAPSREHMPLDEEFRSIITEYIRRKAANQPANILIHAPTCWEIDLSFSVAGAGVFRVRNLREGDLDALLAFGRGLGAVSKEFFCPYPWGDEQRLCASFLEAIANSVQRTTASYLMEHDDGYPIGHFFLWGAGGNTHSREHGMELPELGIAFADAYHGRGFGSLAVKLLQAAADSLGADGIELTTAMNNEPGWNTYLNAGFEYVGILRIPLGVDVLAATAGAVAAERFRDERQMVYIINTEKREAILRYLAMKRGEG